jgi:hypothetical protein
MIRASFAATRLSSVAHICFAHTKATDPDRESLLFAKADCGLWWHKGRARAIENNRDGFSAQK